MLLRQRFARKGDPDGVQGIDRALPFAAIDPGAYGGLVIVADRRVRALYPLSSTPQLLEAAYACAAAGVRLLICEEQFMGKNAASTMRIVFGAGVLVGSIVTANDLVSEAAVQLDRSSLDFADLAVEVIWTPPATWQRFTLPLRAGTKNNPVLSPEIKAAARAIGDRVLGKHPRYRAGTNELRQAYSDAFGIARWWLRIRAEG